jgi:hypothetical protein
MLTAGRDFEFIVEKDKVDKVKRVIAHNDGEVIGEAPVQGDVRIKVRKLKNLNTLLP